METFEELYYIDTGYAYAGIILNEEGVVIESAPIFKWMIGKHLLEICNWKKIKEIRRINEFTN